MTTPPALITNQTMNKVQTHEIFKDHKNVKMGSEKSFGLVFSIVFLIIALWPINNDNPIHYWALIFAFAFLVCALFYPKILKPLNVLWFKFGLLLHKIVNPLILGFVFILTVVPTGLIMRLLKKDLLRLRRNDEADTYWITRDPKEQSLEHYKRQF